MKKIILSCMLCLCFVFSGFATTSFLVRDDADSCRKRCPPRSEGNCPLITCEFTGNPNNPGVSCSYEAGTCSGDLEIE